MTNWNRVDGWAIKLNAVIEKHNQLPFQYGVSDCGILAADVVEAVMGSDVLAAYRGYKTQKGAGRVLRKHKLADVGELFAKHFKEINKMQAMRGDIGVVDIDGGIAGGVFTGTGFAGKGENGIFFADFEQISRAFEVR